VKLIKDVSLKMNFYNCIEQRHPNNPNYEISVSLESMTVTASDSIFKSLMAIKDKVLENMKDKEESSGKEAAARGTTKSQGPGIQPPRSRPGITIEEVVKESDSMLDGIEEEEKKDPSIF